MGDVSSYPGQDGCLWVSISISYKPPTHYSLKLQLFSQLANNKKIESYTSSDFQAGGCKWKLVLHPNGNKSKGVTNHLSLYLVMVEPNSHDPSWEIQAVFRLSLLDQNKDCYLTLQDTAEKGRRFNRTKLAWGFDKFVPLDTFNDAANGYLVNDTCIFGAEVYVCREQISGKEECLSMIKDAVAYKNTWRVDFSNLTQLCMESKPFDAAGHTWKIQLHPAGKEGSGVDGYISLFLSLAAPENLPAASKICAEFTLRMLDQVNRMHYFRTSNYWFSASNSTWGWLRFVSHEYFTQATAGLVFKYVCIVEAELKIHGVVTDA